VHDTVRTDLLRFDAEALSAALKSQPILYWVRYNFEADAAKAEALAPCPSWQVEPPRDEADTANTLKTLGEAFNSLNAAGVAVDKRALLDEFKIPYVGNGEMEPKLPPKPGGPDEEKEDDEKDEKALAALAASRGVPGWEKGQKYPDKLVAHGVEAAQRALAVDLGDLLTLVRAAKSPEALKAALVEFYAELSSEDLEGVLRKGAVLARLNGRESVVEEL
jgi:phage gp29-like protein